MGGTTIRQAHHKLTRSSQSMGVACFFMRNELGPFIYTLMESCIIDMAQNIPSLNNQTVRTDLSQNGEIKQTTANQFLQQVFPDAQIEITFRGQSLGQRIKLTPQGLKRIGNDGWWSDGTWQREKNNG